MVRHIVMWQLKDEHNGMEKDELIVEMTEKLLALKGKISELKTIEVGINGIHFDKNSDLVLITEFESFDDLATYSSHPEHLIVVDFVKEIATGRACVDFDY